MGTYEELKSNTKIPVASIFFEASSLRYISQRALLTTNPQPATFIKNITNFFDFYDALVLKKNKKIFQNCYL